MITFARKLRQKCSWKLKSAAHYDLERKNHDAGEGDIEEES